MRYIKYYSSPLGRILLASDSGDALSGLWFEGGRFFDDALSVPCEECDLRVFDDTARWLDIYFGGREPDFAPAFEFPEASAFRREVWEILKCIPYGEVISYGDIASVMAARRNGKVSARAVGGAVGHNPIGIIVPCHRVVGAGGSMTGYAGGLDRKVRLLEIEGVIGNSL